MVILLLILSGIIWGMMDSGMFHNFPIWMTPVNPFAHDSNGKWRFEGLAEFIPTNGWHIGKMIIIFSFCYLISPTWYCIGLFFYVQIGFQITYWILNYLQGKQ